MIAPGGDVLDLIPTGDKLVLELKIQPIDIDVVRPDLLTTVHFVAYKQRTTPFVEGKVTRVSADAVTDERRRLSTEWSRWNRLLQRKCNGPRFAGGAFRTPQVAFPLAQ